MPVLSGRSVYPEEYMYFFLEPQEFEREKGLKRTTISRWFRILGLKDKPSPIMSKKLSQTEQELRDRIHESSSGKSSPWK